MPNTALDGGSELFFVSVQCAPTTVVAYKNSVGPVGAYAPAREKRTGTFSGKSETGIHWTAIAAEYPRALARDLAFTLLAPVRARLQGC